MQLRSGASRRARARSGACNWHFALEVTEIDSLDTFACKQGSSNRNQHGSLERARKPLIGLACALPALRHQIHSRFVAKVRTRCIIDFKDRSASGRIGGHLDGRTNRWTDGRASGATGGAQSAYAR